MPSIWSCLCIKRQRINVTRRRKPWKKRSRRDTTSSSNISVSVYRQVTSQGGYDVIFTGENVAAFPVSTDGNFDGNTMTKLLEETGPKKRRRVQDIFKDLPELDIHHAPPGSSEQSSKYTTEESKGSPKYVTEHSQGSPRYATEHSQGLPKYTTEYSQGSPRYATEHSQGPPRYATEYSQGPTRYATGYSEGSPRHTTPYLPQMKNILTRIPVNRNMFLGQTHDSESMYGYVPKATQNVYASTALEGRHVEDYFSDCRMNVALSKFASADMCQNMERLCRGNVAVDAVDASANYGNLSTTYDDVAEDARTGLCESHLGVIQTPSIYCSEPLIVGGCPASIFSSETFVCGTYDDILY